MYNTDYVVKYHDIQYELVTNLRRMDKKKQEEKERQEEKAKQEIAAALLENAKKKKGGRKKTVKDELTVPVEAVSIVEPKKRGRKKAVKDEAVKVEEPVVKVEEPVVKDELVKVEEPVVKDELVKVEEETKVEDDSDDEDLDIEYTMEDVHTICDKLYRDELCSVFEAESINDPNMDAGIKRVIEKMIDNANFKQLLEDIKNEIIDVSKFTGTPAEIANMVRNSEYLIFITLFSQHVFYMTHICICQLFTINDIDPELIIQLKNKTISLFKR
jgi:hypothetical protein